MPEKMCCIPQIFACLLLLVTVSSVQATPIIIDDFSHNQSFSNSTVGTTVTDTLVAMDILGGVRESKIRVTKNELGLSDAAAIDEAASLISISNKSQVNSVVTLLWDNSGAGLGGVDFTDKGTNIGVELLILFADKELNLTFDVADTKANTGSCTTMIPATITNSEQLFFPFSQFSGSVDFTTMHSIQMMLDGPESWDATVDLVGITNHTPEPTTISLVGLGLFGLFGLGIRQRRKSK